MSQTPAVEKEQRGKERWKATEKPLRPPTLSLFLSGGSVHLEQAIEKKISERYERDVKREYESVPLTSRRICYYLN